MDALEDAQGWPCARVPLTWPGPARACSARRSDPRGKSHLPPSLAASPCPPAKDGMGGERGSSHSLEEKHSVENTSALIDAVDNVCTGELPTTRALLHPELLPLSDLRPTQTSSRWCHWFLSPVQPLAPLGSPQSQGCATSPVTSLRCRSVQGRRHRPAKLYLQQTSPLCPPAFLSQLQPAPGGRTAYYH